MNKKKFTALFLAAVCVFSMTACGDSGKQSEPSVNNDLSVESDQKAPENENGEIDINSPGDGKETNTDQNVETPDAQNQADTQAKQPEEKKPEPEKKPEQKPAQTQKPAEQQKPAETQKPAEQQPTDLRAKAKTFEGKSVSSLKAAVGSPNSSSYSPSCMGEGEDGELVYNGFTVYTYRENGSERVVEVV